MQGHTHTHTHTHTHRYANKHTEGITAHVNKLDRTHTHTHARAHTHIIQQTFLIKTHTLFFSGKYTDAKW